METAVACNLHCIMCPWHGVRRQKDNSGIMSQSVWDALCPYLLKVHSIDFSGGGEPLLQPRLAEWIQEAKAAGCETGFLTNGVLLTKETAWQMVSAGVNWIAVSMDGATADTYEKIRKGSDFNRLCENLRALSLMRDENVPRLAINFVIMTMNVHQMSEIIELAAHLGVDQVNFKQCDVVRGEKGKGYGLFSADATKAVRRLKKELARARRLGKKRNIHTTAFPFIPDEQPVCGQDPRDSIFVRQDGYVAPCINLAHGGPSLFLGKAVIVPTIHYGRLPEESLIDLWEKSVCRDYRKRFQDRVRAYDSVFFRSAFEASWLKLQETMQSARDEMPEAPAGCRICHYLYNV